MATPMTIITPIIHLNGNSYRSLVAALEQASRAVDAALDALAHTTPNGRNYSPEPGRLQTAGQQHRARVDHLRAVLQSLDAEACTL